MCLVLPVVQVWRRPSHSHRNDREGIPLIRISWHDTWDETQVRPVEECREREREEIVVEGMTQIEW